jgi:hypothetical protein
MKIKYDNIYASYMPEKFRANMNDNQIEEKIVYKILDLKDEDGLNCN